jgi:hypothetical protein
MYCWPRLIEDMWQWSLEAAHPVYGTPLRVRLPQAQQARGTAFALAIHYETTALSSALQWLEPAYVTLSVCACVFMYIWCVTVSVGVVCVRAWRCDCGCRYTHPGERACERIKLMAAAWGALWTTGRRPASAILICSRSARCALDGRCAH